MAKAELFQQDIPKDERVFYYTSEEDDPIKTDEQERKEKILLPDGYEYIPKKSVGENLLADDVWNFLGVWAVVREALLAGEILWAGETKKSEGLWLRDVL